MHNKIYPCLWFNKNAMEAATFYTSIFPNSTILSKNEMTVQFTLLGSKIMGLNGGSMYSINPAISFMIYCKNESDVDKFWAQLSENGTPLMDLNAYPWSKKYGWIKDKFGLTWQIMLHESIEQDITFHPSLLFVENQCGKALHAIEYYTTICANAKKISIEKYVENDSMPAGYLKYGLFSLFNYNFSAMDGIGNQTFFFNEAVSFVIECNNQDEIDYYWSTLGRNGQPGMCGWLKDKFGISWQILPTNLGNILSNPATSKNAWLKLMKMKKIII
ncbi:MAG: VOC family protein, partial [Sediminibacterium sp.]|nr:VOC family protein [Sediminibacterium sp.]